MRALIAVLLLTLVTACGSTSSSLRYETPTPEFEATNLGSGVTYIRDIDFGNAIIIEGEITKQTDDVAIYALRADPSIRTVWLWSSDGGYVVPAQTLGWYIHYNRLDTVIVERCLSACVDIFVAGDTRLMYPDAFIGVHAPSVVTPGVILEDDLYYSTVGVPQMLHLTHSVPHTSAEYYNSREALSLGVATHILN